MMKIQQLKNIPYWDKVKDFCKEDLSKENILHTAQMMYDHEYIPLRTLKEIDEELRTVK